MLVSWDVLTFRLARWAEAQRSPLVFGLRVWGGWAFLGRTARAALSVGALFALLLAGVLLAPHVGLAPWSAADAAGWPLALGMAGWGAGLWAWMLWRSRRAGEGVVPPGPGLAWADALVDLLYRESALAILRGALMPALGAWGIWLAPAVLAAACWARHPRWQTQTSPDAPTWVGYVWAVDWLTTGLFATTGSLWLALLGRALCYLAGLALQRLVPSTRSTPDVSLR
jgi:hypothetical protein